MTNNVSGAEASLALEVVQRRRQQVLAEMGVPAWYWLSLAAGWVVLGAIGVYGPVWVATLATVAFGAAQAAVAGRVISGRRGSSRLSIRSDVVDHRIPALILGFLLLMTGLTVGVAVGLDADGAGHPALWASAVVAALVLSGGPGLVAWIRLRAQKRLSS